MSQPASNVLSCFLDNLTILECLFIHSFIYSYIHLSIHSITAKQIWLPIVIKPLLNVHSKLESSQTCCSCRCNGIKIIFLMIEIQENIIIAVWNRFDYHQFPTQTGSKYVASFNRKQDILIQEYVRWVIGCITD
jgi:hypothetical protein